MATKKKEPPRKVERRMINPGIFALGAILGVFTFVCLVIIALTMYKYSMGEINLRDGSIAYPVIAGLVSGCLGYICFRKGVKVVYSDGKTEDWCDEL